MSIVASLIQALSDFTIAVKGTLTDKVDKVEGKQLSTEDFTAEDKAKLTEVKSMAQRDLHVGAAPPSAAQGADGDVWVVLKP